MVVGGMAGAYQQPIGDEAHAAEAVSAVMEANPGLNDTAEPHSRDVSGIVTAREPGLVASMDISEGGAAEIRSHADEQPAVSIDFADKDELAGPDVDSETGIATYRHEEDFTYVPVLRDDATLQAHTVIEGPDAPTRYTYRISVPDGGQMVAAGDAVLVLDSEGEMVAGVAPPWAKDADGRELPTAYEIHGDLLTQVVEHSDAAYPVVADPWLGVNLFGHVYKNMYKNQPRVNANLSPLGWAIYAGVGSPYNISRGQIILNSAGYKEVLSRGQDIRDAFANKPSMNQQFSCHALGALIAGEWGLERVRPTLNVPWTKDVLSHRCNWNHSDGRV